jgi:hypothetical protein
MALFGIDFKASPARALLAEPRHYKIINVLCSSAVRAAVCLIISIRRGDNAVFSGYFKGMQIIADQDQEVDIKCST